MVGEIRDPETAQTAVQAALTGHLVLATLHARDAVRAIPRLIDMDVEPYQLSAALTACVSQRLLRRLCPLCCRQASDPNLAEELDRRGVRFPIAQGRQPVGCDHCFQTGYNGRISATELLLVDDQISSAISRRQDTLELERLASNAGYRPLAADALTKAESQIISLDEALAVGAF